MLLSSVKNETGKILTANNIGWLTAFGVSGKLCKFNFSPNYFINKIICKWYPCDIFMHFWSCCKKWGNWISCSRGQKSETRWKIHWWPVVNFSQNSPSSESLWCEWKVLQQRLIMVMESVYEGIGGRVNSLERQVS